MKATIIGSGAVGGFYGSLLAKRGVEVSVVARTDYSQIKERGIVVEDKDGDYLFRPAQVVRDASELTEKPDYVLLCVKVVEGVNRVALLRDAVGPDTAVVLISNGIDVEAEIAEAYPDNEIVGGLAFICVTRTGPGRIWRQAYGRLSLGNYPKGLSDKTRALCAVYAQAGINCVPSEDIVADRWRKCVWNAAFNPLSVLSGGLSTSDILKTQEGFVRAVMAEVVAVAAACGYKLPEDIVDINVDSTFKMPPYKTSMLLDCEAGRPMEIEAILGAAVRRGRSLGVAIPRLESLYALMKMREFRAGRP